MTASIPVLNVVIDPQTKFLKHLPFGPNHPRRPSKYESWGEIEFATSEIFSDRQSVLCSGARTLANKLKPFNIPTLWVATDKDLPRGLYTKDSFKSEKGRQKFIHKLGLNFCGLEPDDLIWIKPYPSIFYESPFDAYHPLDMNRSLFGKFLNAHRTKVLIKSGQFTSLCVSRSLQSGKDHFLCIALTDRMADNLECTDTLPQGPRIDALFSRWPYAERLRRTHDEGGYLDSDSLTARTDFGNPFWHKERLMELGPETMEGVIMTQSRKILNLLEKNKGAPLTPELFLQQARRDGTLVQKPPVPSSACTPA